MSEIKNGGLDQYVVEPFEQQQLGTAGVEGVNAILLSFICEPKIHRVSKNCAKLFLSERCQIFTNFDNF